MTPGLDDLDANEDLINRTLRLDERTDDNLDPDDEDMLEDEEEEDEDGSFHSGPSDEDDEDGGEA